MNDATTQQWAAQAQAAAQAGDRARATALWQQVLNANPAEPRALNFLGNTALNTGDVGQAISLLERAVAAEPGQPALWYNLALAYRARPALPQTMDALHRALSLEPYFLQALLLRADVLEVAGQPRAAAQTYADALKCVDETATPPAPLQRQLDHARAVVAREAELLHTFLSDALAPARANAGDHDNQRFQACLDVLTQKTKVYYPAPTFLNYPGLPVIEFFDTTQFSWIAELEAATAAIQAECATLMREGIAAFAPYVSHASDGPLNQWAALNNNKDWSAFYLWRDGVRQDENCARCPQTSAILDKIPRADVPGRAPAAFFSLLRPHTHIPPHTGVTNTRVIVHLPLIIPDNCWFRVGSQTRTWTPGTALVFDDTLEHEAMNDSDDMRAVLIFDIWNPALSTQECALVASLVQKYGAFHGNAGPEFGNA